MGGFYIMNFKKIAVVILSGLLLTGCSSNHGVSANSPITITLGSVENSVLSSMVDEYNSTSGKDKGINIELKSFSSESEISGVDVILADYDTIYNMGTTGNIADLSPYYSSVDLGKTYSKKSLEMSSLSGLRAIPVSSDINVLAVNQTLWNSFASANSFDTSSLSTWDNILNIANIYLDYSNGQPFLNISNTYDLSMEISYQMNEPIAQASQEGAVINLTANNMQFIWDNICVPQIKGLYSNTDISSISDGTSVVTYCALSEVPNDDNILVLQAPYVANGNVAYLLDVDALAINSTDDAIVYAGVQFINWFTSKENNLDYALDTRTVPVNINSLDVSNVKNILYNTDNSYDINVSGELLALDIVNNNQCFRISAFDNVNYFKDILTNKLNQGSSYGLVSKKRSNGVLEDKLYEGILDDTSFKTWYDDICTNLKATFGE